LHVRLQLTMPLGARELADHVAREALDDIRLVRHAVRAERRALDAEALEQERAEMDLLELAPAEEAGHDHAPVRRECDNVLVQCDAPTKAITTSASCPPVTRSTSFAKSCVLYSTPAVAPLGSPDVTKSSLSWLDAVAVTVALRAVSRCDGGRGREVRTRRRAGRAGSRRSRRRMEPRG
jgi:hypothetical protein